jgi:outer membrane protein
MSTQPQIAPLMALALGMALFPPAARAADTTIGFGLGVAPSFPGARDVIAVPLPSLEIAGDRVTWRTNNFGLEAGVSLGGAVSAGPILRLDAGRGSLFAVNDVVVSRLARVKAAPEAGGFVEIGGALTTSWQWNGRVSLVQGFGAGHGGLLGEASVGVLIPAGRSATIAVSMQASWQNRRYAQAYFGVDAAGAARSGLPAFQAGAGLRDLGLGAVYSRSLSRRWSLSVLAALGRMQGAAQRSPIVRERGRAWQPVAGLALSYQL